MWEEGEGFVVHYVICYGDSVYCTMYEEGLCYGGSVSKFSN